MPSKLILFKGAVYRLATKMVTLYRGEPIFTDGSNPKQDLRRVRKLESSVGKSFPPIFTPVYCTPDLSIAKQYVAGMTAAKGETTKGVVITLSTPLDNLEIDEASITNPYIFGGDDPEFLGDMTVDRAKVIGRFFGPSAYRIVRDDPRFRDPKVVASILNNPEALEDLKQTLLSGGDSVVTPHDENPMGDLLTRVEDELADVIEEIQTDPDAVEYLFRHKPAVQGLPEWAFRLRDPDAATVVKVVRSKAD